MQAFQPKANRPLTNKCMEYIVNKFEEVVGDRGGRRGPKRTSLNRSRGGVMGSQMNKFEEVWRLGGRHMGRGIGPEVPMDSIHPGGPPF